MSIARDTTCNFKTMNDGVSEEAKEEYLFQHLYLRRFQ